MQRAGTEPAHVLYSRRINTPTLYSLSARSAKYGNANGSSNSVKKVADTMPPTITTANGRCVSEPIPCDSAAGSKPRPAISAVIKIGRRRATAPSTALAANEVELRASSTICSTMMTPFCTEIPATAMKPTAADTEKCSPAAASAAMPPISVNGTIAKNQQRLADRAEGPEQQGENQQHGDRHDHFQPLYRALLVFKLAAPGDLVAGRQVHQRRHFLLRLGDEAALVATQQIGLDRGIALAAFAADARRALAHADARHVAQRHRAGIVRQRHLQAGDVVDRGTEALLQAQGDVEAPVALVIGVDGAAGQRRLDGVIDIGDVDAEARDAATVDDDVDFGLAADLDRRHVGGTGDAIQDGGHLIAFLRQHVQLRTGDLHRDLALHAGQRLFHVILDHLREVGGHSRNCPYFSRDIGNEFVLVRKAP